MFRWEWRSAIKHFKMKQSNSRAKYNQNNVGNNKMNKRIINMCSNKKNTAFRQKENEAEEKK